MNDGSAICSTTVNRWIIPYVGDNNLYDFNCMLQVEALVAPAKTIASETIEGSSAADYNIERAFNNKEAMITTLGLATLKKMRQATR